MQKIIGLLLIIAAFILGYFGFDKLNKNKAELKIGDIEISAKDSNAQTQGYAMLGGGALCLIVGAWLVARRSK